MIAHATTRTRPRRLHALILGVGLLLASPAWAQGAKTGATPEPQRSGARAPAAPAAYTAALGRANEAYNAGRYDEAVGGYVEAIQADPTRPQAYRNLARAHFWQDQYAAAAAAYDHYLRLAPEAADLEQVRAERRLAAERAGDEVWTIPEAQRLTLAALTTELESGQAYSRGGGGAWGLYQTLLRTGYADPELARIRARLARRLVDEAEAVMVPDANQLTPQLDLESWQLQAERLAAARSLTSDEALLDVIERRTTAVESAVALLTGQPDQAASLAGLALERNPDLPFVRWFEVSALLDAQRDEEALEAVESAARVLLESSPSDLGYARVLRAIVLERLGRSDDAAAVYLDILRE